VGRIASVVGDVGSGGVVPFWVCSVTDGGIPVGGAPPDGDRQAARRGRRKKQKSKALFRYMSRIVLSTPHFVNYAIFYLLWLECLFPSHQPLSRIFSVVSLPFRGPVCNPFGAKGERIGCLGRITVNVSLPGNFEILKSRLRNFRL